VIRDSRTDDVFVLPNEFKPLLKTLEEKKKACEGGWFKKHQFSVFRVIPWLVLFVAACVSSIGTERTVAVAGFLINLDKTLNRNYYSYKWTVAKMSHLLEKLTKDLSGSIREAVKIEDERKRLDKYNAIIGDYKVIISQAEEQAIGIVIQS
jgi:hypothetical protein